MESNEKMLVEYVRRPVYGQVSKNIIDKVEKLASVANTDEYMGLQLKEVEKLLKSTINNQKIGMLVAVQIGEHICIGYSQWNKKADKLNCPDEMSTVAVERMTGLMEKEMRNPNFVPRVPFHIAERLPTFIRRCRRYFKYGQLPNWAVKMIVKEQRAEIAGDGSTQIPKLEAS